MDKIEWYRVTAAAMAPTMLGAGVGAVADGQAPNVEFVSVPISGPIVTGGSLVNSTTSGPALTSWFGGGPIDHATSMVHAGYLALRESARLRRPGFYVTRHRRPEAQISCRPRIAYGARGPVGWDLRID